MHQDQEILMQMSKFDDIFSGAIQSVSKFFSWLLKIACVDNLHL